MKINPQKICVPPPKPTGNCLRYPEAWKSGVGTKRNNLLTKKLAGNKYMQYKIWYAYYRCRKEDCKKVYYTKGDFIKGDHTHGKWKKDCKRRLQFFFWKFNLVFLPYLIKYSIDFSVFLIMFKVSQLIQIEN